MARWPFRRTKKSDVNVPNEVQEYYDAERRQHMGVAWLIAFLSLVVTVIVATGLFFGGRWTYRKLAHKSPATVKTAQSDTKQNGSESSESKANDKNTSKDKSSNSSAHTKSSNASGTSEQKTASNRNATGSTLPDTGPGNTLAIFMTSTAVGVTFYQLILRRKLSRS